jgi:dihydrofolate reductase
MIYFNKEYQLIYDIMSSNIMSYTEYNNANKRPELPEYNMIVAHDINRGIGNQGRIPWYISEDLKYFRELTEFSTVVMGRKTYESIPANRRPLKNRMNIVLTKDKNLYRNDNNLIYTNEDKLFYWIHLLNNNKVFFIGGYEIYKKWMSLVDNLYVTFINKSYECDVFFPKYENDFKLKQIINNIYSENEECDIIFKHYIQK